MLRTIRIFPHHHLAGNLDDFKKGIDSAARNLKDFFGRSYLITPSGRYGITAIINSLQLKPEDEIYITTSSESAYVTSCVTCTIFNSCKPSRVLTDKTKVIFIIHEFGIPNSKTIELIDYAEDKDIIVIEDCAHTFDSKIEDRRVGTMGDYAIYSLTKIFPLSEGGVITGPDIETIKPQDYNRLKMQLLEEKLNEYLPLLDKFSQRRVEHFIYLQNKFRDILMKPVYEIEKNITPYFFPLDTHDCNPELIKDELEKRYIECGVWWGKNALLLPNHPLLTLSDLDYMVDSVKDVL
jgi:dTDP-4-amino-4,6-dideoxygalactose transaminase